MFILRDYQQNVMDAIRSELGKGHKRVMTYLPTGAGKTVLASHILTAAAGNGHKSMFIVDRRVLVPQAVEAFERMGLQVGILQGENTKRFRSEQVIVASIQTLRSRKVLPADVRLVVIDEAHILHKYHIEVMKKWNNLPFIGLSATPLRPDLGEHFESLVRGPSVKELTDEGMLVPVKAFCPSMDVMESVLGAVKVIAGDYAEGELGKSLNRKDLIGDIVDTWKSKASDRLTMCFAVDIAHSKSIIEDFLIAGIPAAHMDGNTPPDERAILIKQLRTGEIQVLSSVNVLGIGTDIPEVSCGIMARPTLSPALQMQYVGRLLRPYEGKEFALLLDHAGNSLRFGLPIDFEVPDLGTEDNQTSKAKRKERKMVDCKNCGAVMPPACFTCQECGTDRPVRIADVVIHDARLIAYGTDNEGQVDVEVVNKLRWYLSFKYIAEHSRSGKTGWAYHLYMAKFNEKPAWEWKDMKSINPDDDVTRWMKYWRIRNKKSKKKLYPNAVTADALT